MKYYDYVFITNIPSFYKVNLFNNLAKYCRVKVIFISRTSEIRDSDFYDYDHKFDSEYISDKDFERRNPLMTLLGVYSAIKKYSFNKLVFPGWEIKELFLLAILNGRNKNAVVIESSINESITYGYAWLLKKFYMGRMGTAFPAGKLQEAILDKMAFDGDVIVTHGVGIPNYIKTVKKKPSNNTSLNYLYIGRLSPEKNISALIEVFRQRRENLTIVGSGPDEKLLKEMAGSNIKFLGYVDNKKLEKIYQAADVFILPSKSEPWGLVIDEALSFGLPIIVSNKVGCIDDLACHGNGLIFDVDNQQSLINCMDKMLECHQNYADAASKIDMHAVYQKQIFSYLKFKQNER